jgi:hypothetical protein
MFIVVIFSAKVKWMSHGASMGQISLFEELERMTALGIGINRGKY